MKVAGNDKSVASDGYSLRIDKRPKFPLLDSGQPLAELADLIKVRANHHFSRAIDIAPFLADFDGRMFSREFPCRVELRGNHKVILRIRIAPFAAVDGQTLQRRDCR